MVNQTLFNFDQTLKKCTACNQTYHEHYFIKNTCICKNCKKLRNKIYRDRLKTATPKWLTSTMIAQINQFKKIASELSSDFISYEIDHIEALKGKNGCGLNVPWNLQIITSTENKIKKNNNGFIQEILNAK